MFAQAQWSYWAEQRLGGAELASWCGDRLPETRAHFHDEDQITLILSGIRAFSIADREFEVREGHCLAIPAGLPHQSLLRPNASMQCVNIYLGAGTIQGSPFVFPMDDHLDYRKSFDPTNLRERILLQIAHPFSSTETVGTRIGLSSSMRGPIAKIAKAHGLSREGFSRNFRREAGMPPHAFRLMLRLNAARRQLRAGHGIASVAAEFGFADQSHFGRHFRNAFGVTPGAYIGGVTPSQTFQT